MSSRGPLSLVIGLIASFLLGVALVLALALVLPAATGHRSLTVLTGSMEPTLETGSVVIDEVISPAEARIGDIVTFSDPARAGRLVTHRLQAARLEGGTARMVTKGDANDAPERWSVATDGEIGRVRYHLPKVGFAKAMLGSQTGYLVLMIAVFALGARVLADVWRQPRRTGNDTAAGAG